MGPFCTFAVRFATHDIPANKLEVQNSRFSKPLYEIMEVQKVAEENGQKEEEAENDIWRYSGISIKRTHHKADISVRRTVNQGTVVLPVKLL